MADAARQQPPIETERRIGSTTYIVTSYFQEQGSTAVDRIRGLINKETKGKEPCRKN